MHWYSDHFVKFPPQVWQEERTFWRHCLAKYHQRCISLRPVLARLPGALLHGWCESDAELPGWVCTRYVFNYFFSDIVANEPFCTMAVDCALTDYPTGLRWLPSSFPAFSKTERSFLQAQRSWVVFQEFSSPVCACLACTCAVWCCCRPPPTWSDTGGIWRCCWLCRAWPTCRSGGKLISAHYQDSNASQGRLNGKVATKPGSSYSWWHLCSRRNLGS